VTVIWKQVSLGYILKYVTLLSSYTVGQRGDIIYLLDAEGVVGPLVERTYSLDPSGMWKMLGPPPTPSKVEEWLQGIGVTMYEGGSAVLTSSGRLTVRGPKEQIDLCEGLFCSPDPTVFQRMKSWFSNLKLW
jgi:hypothetical protein